MNRLRLAMMAFWLVPPVTAADLPEGPGRDLLVRVCTGCHKLESFASYRFTRDEYHAIVYRMAERGAQATGPELDQIAEYLARNFLKVEDPARLNINKATAEDMEARLGLTAKEAEAVVSYRERHGDFHAVGDLYVIYGVDSAKIQAAKDKISF